MTGRGAGLSDEGLRRKIDAIRARHCSLTVPMRPTRWACWQALGGLDIAGLCGVFLGGALENVPILMDGFISGVAALCAVRLCPAAAKAVFASHVSSEPAARLVLEELDKKPLHHRQSAPGRRHRRSGQPCRCGIWPLRSTTAAIRLPRAASRRTPRNADAGHRRLGQREKRFAESLCLQSPLPRTYLATMQVWDAECAARVARHRAMRAQKRFDTVECPLHLDRLILPRRGTVLLEDLGNLTANELYAPDGAGEKTADGRCKRPCKTGRAVR